jgi:UDP-glucose 4-epimerase
MKHKTVVITGGAGFIGSHLCEALCEDNEVRIIDNLSSGSRDNITPFLSAGATLLEASITDAHAIGHVFEGADYVFHEAALASVPQSIADPVAATETNVMGPLAVLELARRHDVGKVVFASSSRSTATPTACHIDEERILAPCSPYAATKITGEYYLSLYTELYGLPTASLRYFNVYGPRQDPSSDYAAVIPKFIACCRAGEAPVIFGDGTQTRDFVSVRDVVTANILAAQSRASGAYNIASGAHCTITELARTVSHIMGCPAQPVFLPPRHGDIVHSYASIAKAQKDLSFFPKITLDDGLRETAAYGSAHPCTRS